MKFNRFSIFATMLILVGVLLVPSAFAQRAPVAHPATFPSCPASVAANPLALVDGQTWVFHWEGVEHIGGAAGNFTFEMVASPNSQAGFTGFLNVIESRNLEGTIFRFLNYNGRYQIYPNCSGGVLMFNSGTPASVEFDFYFREREGNAFGALDMVSIDPIGTGSLTSELAEFGIFETGEAWFQPGSAPLPPQPGH